jgi:hypothetical protein
VDEQNRLKRLNCLVNLFEILYGGEDIEGDGDHSKMTEV